MPLCAAHGAVATKIAGPKRTLLSLSLWKKEPSLVLVSNEENDKQAASNACRERRWRRALFDFPNRHEGERIRSHPSDANESLWVLSHPVAGCMQKRRPDSACKIHFSRENNPSVSL